MMTQTKRRSRGLVLVVLILAFGGMLAFAMRPPKNVQQDVVPTETSVEQGDAAESSPTRESSMEDVMELATTALRKMESGLNDYSARFVQQERNDSGALGEKTEMFVKIQTRLRNESNDAPMRIYLKFLKPDASAGREVLWAQDMNDGLMAVYEKNNVLVSWKTLWLDPEGMLAMAGQKYPIYEMGLLRLVEQLIERGQRDIGNANAHVKITRDHEFDGRICDLIQVTHDQPTGEEDDFSLAEIVYDPERLLIISYRSFGWVENPDDEVPLLESYQYLDLKTNNGFTDRDFDVANEEYHFP